VNINRFNESMVMPVCFVTVKSGSFINSMTVAWRSFNRKIIEEIRKTIKRGVKGD